MDINELEKLNKKFDLIECCGVLHHMKDPLKGLSKLTSILNKNGYMKIALYSEIARSEIIKARDLVSSNKLEANEKGIKIFRENVINGKYPEVNNLYLWEDFYTTSMFRDLCFHSQEKRYTLYEIKDMISSTNLEFMGFVLPDKIKNDYTTKYRNDSRSINLINWIEFENNNPDTFKSMYQFWVRFKN